VVRGAEERVLFAGRGTFRETAPPLLEACGDLRDRGASEGRVCESRLFMRVYSPGETRR
jgi:hypothetical protein